MTLIFANFPYDVFRSSFQFLFSIGIDASITNVYLRAGRCADSPDCGRLFRLKAAPCSDPWPPPPLERSGAGRSSYFTDPSHLVKGLLFSHRFSFRMNGRAAGVSEHDPRQTMAREVGKTREWLILCFPGYTYDAWRSS